MSEAIEDHIESQLQELYRRRKRDISALSPSFPQMYSQLAETQSRIDLLERVRDSLLFADDDDEPSTEPAFVAEAQADGGILSANPVAPADFAAMLSWIIHGVMALDYRTKIGGTHA